MKNVHYFRHCSLVALLLLAQYAWAQPSTAPALACPTIGELAPESVPESFVPICDDPSVIRYIPVAVHFIQRESLTRFIWDDGCTEGTPTLDFYSYGNFSETDDGLGNPYNGFQRAHDLISDSNDELANNQVHRRKNPSYPTSHYSPAPPINYRYLLAAVLFHHNDDFYANPYGKFTSYHSQYDYGGNEVIDIYMAPNGMYSGAAFVGNSNKYFYVKNWRTYVSQGCRNWSKRYGGRTINHEMGHVLDLHHTWNRNDYCDDTPLGFQYDHISTVDDPCPGGAPCCKRYANCWVDNIPGANPCGENECDAGHKLTNNLMDYRQPDIFSLTPEQIARVNAELASPSANTYINSCNGCEPAMAFMHTEQEYKICNSNSPVTVHAGMWNVDEYLIEICQVVSASNLSCVGGTYYSHGWQSGFPGPMDLAQIYSFSADKFYKVKITANNSSCPSNDVYETVLETKSCSTDPVVYISQLSPVSPFGGTIVVNFTVSNSADLQMYLTHIATGQQV